VNLVSAGLGIAWVPRSVREFQRGGVVYRQLGGRQAAAVPECETTLVWEQATPVLERFIAAGPRSAAATHSPAPAPQ
jgi:DNA-binding transcriptional LysR family regulator